MGVSKENHPSKTYLVVLHLNPQGSVTQAYPIPDGGAKHGNVSIVTNVGVCSDLECPWFRNVAKATLNQIPDNLLRPCWIKYA